MRMTGNTIFITGGGSGIGRALAEALHARGNTVIVSGRRKDRLKAVLDANPGMSSIELDVTDPDSIARAAAALIAEHPALNVLINNAGIMLLDKAQDAVDDALIVSTITTNLIGPIRMTGALIEHLRKQDGAIVANVSSVLGFVPMASTAVYSATKAAVHSYSMSQRYLLREHGVKVIEIAPPWVRTELLNSTEEERAMPLDDFIAGVMSQLETDANEILVGGAQQMRANPGAGEHAFVTQFNDIVAAGPAFG